MLRYTLRRILASLPLLLLVIAATFLLLYALPGDATHALLGQHWSESEAARIRSTHGLDDPLPLQFAHYVADVAQGELGASVATNQPVASELRSRIPATLELALLAMVIATVAGVSLGILAALKPRSWRDMLVLGLALAGVSLPVFLLGILATRALQVGGWLSQVLPWFSGIAVGGRHSVSLRLAEAVEQHGGSGFYLYDTLVVFGDLHAFADVAVHVALPAVVLATIPAALITRITRAAVGEAMAQDYIRTARAKGLSTARVVTRHAMRNASISILTTMGTQFGYLLGGAVLTETLFNWPGLGTYTVRAIIIGDVRPLQGAILFVAIGFIAINLLVDLSYAWLDPRVRRSETSRRGREAA